MYGKEIRGAEPKRGDVIGIKRHGVYKHYAVYIGNDEVIHYANPDGKGDDILGRDNTIHRAPMANFLKGNEKDEFFVLDFPTKEELKKKMIAKKMAEGATVLPFLGILFAIAKVTREVVKIIRDMDYKLYSAEETVERAMSRLNEKKYNLATNNCEHFAIWCKTGAKESHQVENVMDFISMTPVKFALPFASSFTRL
ncbi:MAG: lecithin retinol acyltransferase family protein [Clostridia bacterium]|nr:lecithin retinol acyltransferase family protein [Clostridia bacterium]